MLSATVLLAILLCTGNAEKSSFTNNYQFPPSEDINFFGPGRDMTKLIFTTYNVSQLNSLKRCLITTISGALESSPGVTRQCEISLKPEMPNGVIMNFCKAHEFGSDKVVVLWMEEQNVTDPDKQTTSVVVKTSVVDMTRNCYTVEATVKKYQLVQATNVVPMSLIRPKVIAFDNIYEVLLEDKLRKFEPESTHCDYVLYRFDAEGSKIFGPEDWPFSDSNGTCSTRFTVESAKKGYFITEPDRITLAGELMVEHSNTDPKKQQIWSVSFNNTLEGYGYSLANDAIGLCFIYKNSSFVCWQSDQNGQSRKEVLLKLEHPSKLLIDDVYNLRKGGILLSVFICADSICRHREKYLMEIDRQGTIKSVKCDFDVAPPNKYYFVSRIFENKQDRYCKATIIIPIIGGKLVEAVNTYVRCYSPDEFTKCLEKFCL